MGLLTPNALAPLRLTWDIFIPISLYHRNLDFGNMGYPQAFIQKFLSCQFDRFIQLMAIIYLRHIHYWLFRLTYQQISLNSKVLKFLLGTFLRFLYK